MAKDHQNSPNYAGAGTAASMLANRISWFYNFNGPSANVDSACSRSLLAVDLACQSIWNGTSNMVSLLGLVVFWPFLFVVEEVEFIHHQDI